MSLLGDIFGFIDSGRAAHSISDAGIAAEHGVLDATRGGQQGIQDALSQGRTGVQGAVGQAMTGDRALNAPYIGAGQQGISNLEKYASSPASKFSFNLDDYFNSPAYQFQMKEGTNAINNANAATGSGAGGAALKELTQFGQGLASKYYGDAFNQALGGFQANQNATLANNSTLINAGEGGATRQQAANQMPVSTQELLAQLGLQGGETSAGLGLQGAKTAGDFAVGAGTAHAGGILGQGNALAGLGGDLLSIFSPMVGSIPMGAGGATTLQGIFGG